MKKLLLFACALLLVCGTAMSQKMMMSPRPSDGGTPPAFNSGNWQIQPSQTDALASWVLPTDGSTSGNTRCPGNSFKFQRTEYLITAAEMAASGFPSGYAVDAIGFLIATAGGTSQTGTFNVWLRNTTDVTYTLGTTWTTTGFTQVSSIAAWTVPITVGQYVVNFAGGAPFTYTGGGVYVAWEFSNAGTAGLTALAANCNTALANGLVGNRSATSLPTTLAASSYRPATIFVNNSITDIANITNIYTLEKAPVTYGFPSPINVRVANVSAAAATFDVTLTVKDPGNTITRYTSTQTVTALAANTATILTFTGWTQTQLENANISATTSVIPTETWLANNTKTIQSSVNSTTFGYDYSTAGPSGFGFTYPGTGLFASKFTMKALGSVLGANLMISTDVANTGNTIYAVVMDAAGLIVGQSADYVITAPDLGVNKYFSFPSMPSFAANDDYYVALAQTAGTVQWYPMGTYDETPQRDNTFYTADVTGGTLTVLPNTFNLKYGIEAVVGAPPSVLNPSSFAATAVSTSEIDLSWLLNANGNNVLLAWSPTGTFGTPSGSAYVPGSTISGGGTVLQFNNALLYNHTSLTPNTKYYYKAWSYNGSIYSPGATTNATTFCNATPAPWTENFELTTFPPACWDINFGEGTWERTTAASGYGTGTGAAFADFYNIPVGAGAPFALFSLPFTNGSLSAPTLSFDYAYATYSGELDEMDVYYSTDGGANFSLLLAMPGGTSGILNTGGTVTTAFVPTAAQWATQTLSLPAGTNMIAFNAISAYGNSLYLDNVKIIEGLAHDVGVISILDLRDVYPAGTFSPVATVHNYGGNTETFDVKMDIGAYSSTKTVTALGAGLSQVVTFDPWAATAGDYTLSATATLTGDENGANDVASKAIKVMVLNKQVYAYNAFPGDGTDPEGPTSFNLADPGTLTSLADQSTLDYVTGGTWANGLWYGTVSNGASTIPYNLVTIDPATGARTVIGDMGISMTGLAYNPANGVMYAVGYDGVNSNLYTINMATGAATLVGACGTGLLINLAINAAGTCYTLDMSNANLGQLNLSTGAFTTIGPVGFAAAYAQDMEFDRETGDLFMAAYGATGELRWVNTTTGATLVVGTFEGGAEITGFAIPYTAVTFNVNMNQQTVSPNGVHLAGSFQGWDPGATLMTDPDADGIYSVTLAIAAGTYEFKYVNGNAWGTDEFVPGACSSNGNRYVVVSGDLTLSPVCFGSCSNCIMQVPLTLTVDMANQTVSPNGVHVAGSFQGWNVGSTLLTQIPSTTQYTVTVSVDENSTHQYKFVNGNTWGTDEGVPAACGVDNGFGGYNRSVTVGTVAYAVPVVCFAECSACAPATKTLNLSSVFLEGLYNGGGTMRRAANDAGYLFVDPLVADQVTIELHDATYSSIAYTALNVDLSTSGTASVTIPSTYSGSYYITIKHRNHLETTTAALVSFSGSTVNYAFDMPSQVYGNNLILMAGGGTYYAIYGGDVIADNTIESGDMTPVDNLVASFGYGFQEDANSDGTLDSSDMTIVDNNAAAFVAAVLP